MAKLLVYGTCLSTTSLCSFSTLHLLILATQKCFSCRTESENFEQPINYTLHFIQESQLSPNGHELPFGVIFWVKRGSVRANCFAEKELRNMKKYWSKGDVEPLDLKKVKKYPMFKRILWPKNNNSWDKMSGVQNLAFDPTEQTNGVSYEVCLIITRFIAGGYLIYECWIEITLVFKKNFWSVRPVVTEDWCNRLSSARIDWKRKLSIKTTKW